MNKFKIIFTCFILVLIISGCGNQNSIKTGSNKYSITYLSNPIKISHEGNLTYSLSKENKTSYDFYNLFIADTTKVEHLPNDIQVIGGENVLIGISDFRPIVQTADGEKRYSVLTIAVPKDSDTKTYSLMMGNECFPLPLSSTIEPVISGNVAPDQLFLLRTKDNSGNRLEMLGVFCYTKQKADIEDKLYNKTQLELVFLGMPTVHSEKNPKSKFSYSKIDGDVTFLIDTSRDNTNPNEFVAFSHDNENDNKMDIRGGAYLVYATYFRKKIATTAVEAQAFVKKDFSFTLESLMFTSHIQQ